jgi:LuxR family transcriptional regulator of csgAB operon
MKALYFSQHSALSFSIFSGIPIDPPSARIYILGTNQSLNQLLVMMLETAFGALCTYNGSLPEHETMDLQSGKPTLMLIDCLTWKMDAFEDRLQTDFNYLPATSRIVLLNVEKLDAYEKNITQGNIHGIFYLDDTKANFLQGMKIILEGHRWINRTNEARGTGSLLADKEQVPTSALSTLSDREKEILKYVATGMSNPHIAGELELSLHTVKTHIYNIFKKIGISNRLQAGLWAMANL